MALTLPTPIQKALQQFAQDNDLDSSALKRIINVAIDGDNTAPAPEPAVTEPVEATLARISASLGLSGGAATPTQPTVKAMVALATRRIAAEQDEEKIASLRRKLGKAS